MQDNDIKNQHKEGSMETEFVDITLDEYGQPMQPKNNKIALTDA